MRHFVGVRPYGVVPAILGSGLLCTDGGLFFLQCVDVAIYPLREQPRRAGECYLPLGVLYVHYVCMFLMDRIIATKA